MNEETDLNATSSQQTAEQTPQPQDPYAACVLPENSSLSADSLAALKQQAACVHLPPEMLQSWVELEDKRLKQQAQLQATAQREKEQQWAQETKQLLGPSWEEEVSRAVRAANLFGGAPLRQLLEETGLGNHPAIVRTFAAVGKRISEDVCVVGAASAGSDKTFTQALYGKE